MFYSTSTFNPFADLKKQVFSFIIIHCTVMYPKIRAYFKSTVRLHGHLRVDTTLQTELPAQSRG